MAVQTPELVKKLNSNSPASGLDKLSFFFKLQDAINKRLITGEVKIVALSHFYETGLFYEATGYAKVNDALKPLRVQILPRSKVVVVRVGVIVVEFPLEEVDVE